MDPHDPSSGPNNGPSSNLESDLAASPLSAPRGPAQTPAGSLMSIQIRRRTPPRDRLPVPPAPKAARPETSPVPPTPAVAAPPPVAPEPDIPAPEVPAPEKAAPAAPFPASDPGRRMQSVTPQPAAPSEPPPAEAAAAPPTAPTAPAARAPLTAPGIARYARTGGDDQNVESKPQLAIPATKPAAPRPVAPRPAAPRPAPAQRPTTPPPPEVRRESPAPTAETSRPEGIVSYWLRLRGSRRFPSKADLDQNRIIADWPNSILMRCRSGSKALEPEKVFAGPGQASLADSTTPADTSQAAMELSPMMLQWLLTLAGDAAKDRRPMQDTEAFPSRNQSVRYGAFALPFSEDQSQIDHVLCHVYRAD